MMAGFLNWWDGAELWLSGRGFVLQTVIVMPVVLALAFGVAVGVDALLGMSIRAFRGVEDAPGLKVLRRLHDPGVEQDGPARDRVRQ